MSTKVIRDLTDACRHKVRLRVTCLACDKQSILNPMVLLNRVRANTTLENLGPKLRCSSCGHKKAKVDTAA